MRSLIWLAVIALIACAGLMLPGERVRGWWNEQKGLDRVESRRDWILAAALEARVDPCLLAGITMVESRGHLGAQSKVGALGLCQLMLPTARERAALLGLPEPSREDLLTDGALNLRLAAHYVAWLSRRFDGDDERVSIAYNAGPTRLRRWIDEAGSYAAWRDARERAGNSEVLAYARDVRRYRARFADRGNLVPTAALGSETNPSTPPAVSEVPPQGFGPPAPRPTR